MDFTMKNILFAVAFICCTLSVHSAAIDWDIIELDPELYELQYYPVNIQDSLSHHRVARQTVSAGVNPGAGGGVEGMVGASGNLFNRNGHNVDGHAQVSKNWHPNGPVAVGGGLDYQGPRGGASVAASHARHFGTDVTATGNANLWQSRNGMSRLDGTANYGQHFGGPFGRSRPNYGVGLNFNHRF